MKSLRVVHRAGDAKWKGENFSRVGFVNLPDKTFTECGPENE